MAKFCGLLSLLTLLTCLTAVRSEDTVNICSTRSTPAVFSSILIRSPGYPNVYNPWVWRSCTLTIPVPPYCLVTFVVAADGFNVAGLQTNGVCLDSTYLYLLTSQLQNTHRVCGTRAKGTELSRFYSQWSTSNTVQIELHSHQYITGLSIYKFSIRYTVFNVLDTDVTRSIPSQSHLYFASHSSYGMSQYNHNTDSSLTITDLLPHTAVRLEFPRGVRLPNSNSCSDYLDIVGVRGYPDYTKRICGFTSSVYTADLMSTGDNITFRFKTDSTGKSRGFSFRYTVISAGCSYAELFSNATLSPTPDSKITFTLTCLPGFITSESKQTQTLQCTSEQWMPPLLPCHYAGTTIPSTIITTTTTRTTTATTSPTTTTSRTTTTTRITTNIIQTTTTPSTTMPKITRTASTFVSSALPPTVTTKSPSHPASNTTITSGMFSSMPPGSMTVLYASIGGGVVILVVLITLILMKRRRQRRSSGKNTTENIQQLSERGQTPDESQRTGDTNIYTLEDSTYELSDSYQLAGPTGEVESPSAVYSLSGPAGEVESPSDVYSLAGPAGEVKSPSDVYSLAGPTTETGCSAEKTAERGEKAKNIADVYAVVDVSHRIRKPPTIPVDEESSDTDEEDDTPSGDYSLAGPVQRENSNVNAINRVEKEKNIADVYAVVDVSHKNRSPPAIPVDEESSDTDEEDETPSENYSLAGPVQRENSDVNAINRVQREKNVADVHVAIDASHKKRPPAAPVDVDRNDMVENDLYTSSF